MILNRYNKICKLPVCNLINNATLHAIILINNKLNHNIPETAHILVLYDIKT